MLTHCFSFTCPGVRFQGCISAEGEGGADHIDSRCTLVQGVKSQPGSVQGDRYLHYARLKIGKRMHRSVRQVILINIGNSVLIRYKEEFSISGDRRLVLRPVGGVGEDRKSTRLNSSHVAIS